MNWFKFRLLLIGSLIIRFFYELHFDINFNIIENIFIGTGVGMVIAGLAMKN